MNQKIIDLNKKLIYCSAEQEQLLLREQMAIELEAYRLAKRIEHSRFYEGHFVGGLTEKQREAKRVRDLERYHRNKWRGRKVKAKGVGV